jgi:hypothetical protein
MRVAKRVTGLAVGLGLAALSGCSISSSTCTLNQTNVSSTRYFKIYTNSAREMLAQRFSPTSDVAIANAKVYLSKVGTFSLTTETVSLLIYPTNAGNTAPDTASTALASSSTGYEVRNLSSGASLVTFTFSSSVTLTSGTNYWLVLDAGNLARSDTNYIRWHGSASDADTSHISKYLDSSGNWQLGSMSGSTDPYDLSYQMGCN